MSTQVSLRLSDELVTAVDEIVRGGEAPSRASVMEAALERELRRRAAERDAEIYLRARPGGDLADLEAWIADQGVPRLDG